MKTLVLSSGGLDSTVCLARAVKERGSANVIALSLGYGQKHVKELDASKKIAKFYGVSLLSLDIGEIFAGSRCSLLAESSEDIPEESYEEQLRKTKGEPVTTYVPFRNGLFLSAAAAIALSKGCDTIVYGIHGDDAAGNAYPDTSEAFNNAIGEAVFLGSGRKVRIDAPFAGRSKADVVAEGIRLGVPFELTWSCYAGGDKPCGKCGTCRDRLDAFAKNGITDPLMREL